MTQKAAVEAAIGPQDAVRFNDRRIHETAGLGCSRPERYRGNRMRDARRRILRDANVKQLLGGRVRDSIEFSKLLLDEARVVVTPAQPSGWKVTCGFHNANSLEAIQEGVRRLRK